MAGGEGLLKLIVKQQNITGALDFMGLVDGDAFSHSPLIVQHADNIDTLSFDLQMWDARNKSVTAYVERRGVRLLRRMTAEYFKTVVEYTPYDTGNAIRNWHIIDGNDIPSYNELRNDPVDIGDAQEEALARGELALSSLKRDSKPMVVNPAPYIEALDVGSSSQAPIGMSIHAEAAVIAVWDSFHSGNKDILKENPLASAELGSRSAK